MNCITCNAEIPPSFVHSIQSNVCPGCGGSIVSDETKTIMDQLREAVPKMIDNPEGLVGWILSTFDLKPKGAIEPTTFHGRHNASHTEPASHQLVWANSSTHQFMKRSGADKVLKDPKLAAIAKIINNAGNTMYGDQEIEAEPELSPEEQEELAAQELQETLARNRTGKRLTAKELLANNATFALEDAGPPLNTDELHEISKMIGGTEDYDDINSLPEALQKDRLKRLIAQREIAAGGGNGFVKRSG